MTDRRAEAERPFSVATLAERWGCSRRHVSNLIRKGALQSFRVGALLRVRPEEVERYECGGVRQGAKPQDQVLEI